MNIRAFRSFALSRLLNGAQVIESVEFRSVKVQEGGKTKESKRETENANRV